METEQIKEFIESVVPDVENDFAVRFVSVLLNFIIFCQIKFVRLHL